MRTARWPLRVILIAAIALTAGWGALLGAAPSRPDDAPMAPVEWRFHAHALTCAAGPLAAAPAQWRAAMATLGHLEPGWGVRTASLVPHLAPALRAAAAWERRPTLATWNAAARARDALWADLERQGVFAAVWACPTP